MKKIVLDELKLRDLIENEKLPQWKVAEYFHVSRDTIHYYCKRIGLVTQKSGAKPGDKNPSWKGGRRLVKGYFYIYQPTHPNATKQGYVSQHRLVMEEKIGRYLLPGEVVHHKNDNPLDNDPDNLELFSNNAEHLRVTLKGKTPNWTKEGRENIVKGLRACAIRKRSTSYVPKRNQNNSHLPEKSDKDVQDS